MARFLVKAAFTLAAIGWAAAPASEAWADVNLEYRTPAQNVRVGETVEVGLYAVSDDGGDQAFAALDAILSWDPDALRLVGRSDNGPYGWLLSSFPNDSGLDGLNADCGEDVFCDPSYTGTPFNDGDALYQAIAPFGLDPPPYATPDGLLVTTILFTAVAATPATELRFLEAAGAGSFTRVLDAEPLGGDATGELSSLTLAIAACGSAGDFDGDCIVDLSDFVQFGACLAGPGGGPGEPQCQAADFDDDGDADLHNFAALQLFFGR